MQLVGYNICDGFSCVKNGGFATYTITRAGLSGHPEQWASVSIGDVHWQVGDAVHIRLKVKPVTITENGDVIPDPGMMFFTDLGDSKIMKVNEANNTNNY
jgi:hypothetical protein